TSQNVDFLLLGTLSGSGRITKVDAGTMRVLGTNSSFTSGFRVGIAGSTPQTGGRLLISHSSALGTDSGVYPTLQFNGGILEAEVPLTGATALTAGVSFGAGQINSAVLTGGDMEFLGSCSFFKATGAPSVYTNR